jgi:hypothetical protein
MHELQDNQNEQADSAALSACSFPPTLQNAHSRGHRKIRTAPPAAPRRLPGSPAATPPGVARLVLWQVVFAVNMWAAGYKTTSLRGLLFLVQLCGAISAPATRSTPEEKA